MPDAPALPSDLPARLGEFLRPNSAIVCVGNELRGDDGAGPAVARELADAVPWAVYDTGPAPENWLGPIARPGPASVLIVDAADFGGPPGAVRLLAPDQLDTQCRGTHGPSPMAILEALTLMHPCPCAVLGIQPLRTDVGSALSPPVARAVRSVAEMLRSLG